MTGSPEASRSTAATIAKSWWPSGSSLIWRTGHVRVPAVPAPLSWSIISRWARVRRGRCTKPTHATRVPSLILGVSVGGSAAASAVAAWRGTDAAAPSAIAAGELLVAWIAAQVAIIGPRSPLQLAMAGVGFSLMGLGCRLAVVRDPRRPRASRRRWTRAAR
jgi:hypothetical protein